MGFDSNPYKWPYKKGNWDFNNQWSYKFTYITGRGPTLLENDFWFAQTHDYRLELPPTQDASHHQDYEPFLVGNPELNLHLPLASWVGGVDRNYRHILDMLWR